jgi:hypothetical protein
MIIEMRMIYMMLLKEAVIKITTKRKPKTKINIIKIHGAN